MYIQGKNDERLRRPFGLQATVYRSLLYSCAFVPLLLLASCARWSREQAPETSKLLATPQKSLDSVLIETVLVRFPTQEKDRLLEAWQTADETILDIGLRQRLDRNGLRCGVLLGEIPKVIRDQMDRTSQEQKTNALEHAGLAADVDNKMRRLQCRAGRRKDLVVRPQITEPLTVLCTVDGSVRGDTFQKPAVLFDLRAFPHGDQRATVELTPEIEHGELRQSYVSSEFGVRPEMRRPRQSWKDLTIAAKLEPGQILMLSATLPPKALGSAFFTTQTAERSEEYVVLLLRVTETQLDDLFAPEQIAQADSMIER